MFNVRPLRSENMQLRKLFIIGQYSPINECIEPWTSEDVYTAAGQVGYPGYGIITRGEETFISLKLDRLPKQGKYHASFNLRCRQLQLFH